MLKQRSMMAAALAMAIGLSAGTRAQAADGLDAIGPAMQAFVDKGQISGIVTVVATKDGVIHKNAVGTSDGTRKMEVTDMFWIASMSKPITAVAAAILVDDGKLKFDDPVEKYIPEFKGLKVGTAEATRPIQVRDLLTHTSGLGEYAKTQPHWKLEEYAKQMASQPLRFQPGTRWQYSTAGIDTVGRVVEVASGMPFDKFLQTRLFDPLGMKDTSFWISADNLKRYAHTYILNTQSNKLEETPIHYLYGTEVTDTQRPPLGGAGLFSTGEDIAKFYMMALGKGTYNGKQILKPETLGEMTKNQIGTLTARAGMPWGYGYCVVADPSKMEANVMLTPGSFGHGGAFGTNSWIDPTRGIVYVMMLERDKMGNPDNSPMHIAFQEVASKALPAKP